MEAKATIQMDHPFEWQTNDTFEWSWGKSSKQHQSTLPLSVDQIIMPSNCLRSYQTLSDALVLVLVLEMTRLSPHGRELWASNLSPICLVQERIFIIFCMHARNFLLRIFPRLADNGLSCINLLFTHVFVIKCVLDNDFVLRNNFYS